MLNRKPDYKKATRITFEILKEHDIDSAPISLSQIISKHKNIQLYKYSTFCEKKGISLQCLKDELDSDLGAIVKHPIHNHYIIYYNDVNYSNEQHRFTIAHELGHYFLDHFSNSVTKLLYKQKTLSSSLYDTFEKEANCFARNLLSPIMLVKKVLADFEPTPTNKEILEDLFKIGYSASLTRLKLANWDEQYIQSNYKTFFDNFIFTTAYKFCPTCRSLSQIANFCPICGTNLRDCKLIKRKNLDSLEDKIMIYNKFIYKECPICDNEEIEESHNYCSICGYVLKNTCTNPNCKNNINDISLPKNVRFCHQCGQHSTYYELNHLKSWSDESDNSAPLEEYDDDDLPF